METDRLGRKWVTDHGAPPDSDNHRRDCASKPPSRLELPRSWLPTPLRCFPPNGATERRPRVFEPESVVASTIRRSRTHAFPRWRTSPRTGLPPSGLSPVQRVAAKRSTWNRWNLIAEGERVCAQIRCPSRRPQRAHRCRGHRGRTSIRATQPVSVQRPRGCALMICDSPGAASSISTGRASTRMSRHSPLRTSHGGEETTTAARPCGGPHLGLTRQGPKGNPGCTTISAPRRSVLLSSSRLDAIVGPAGTGKTTTLGAVKAAWEAAYGWAA